MNHSARVSHSLRVAQLMRSRMKQLAVLAWFILMLLIVRMGDVMVVRGDAFRKRADDNRFFTRVLTPHRGIILDRNNTLLVKNNPRYRKIVGNVHALHPELVDIDQKEAFDLMIQAPEQLVYENTRVSLFGPALAHVIGYTGFVDPSRDQDVVSLSQRVGKTGIEKEFDTQLRGIFGSQQFEMSAKGSIVGLLSQTKATSGLEIKTSIDAVLTTHAYELLAGQPGSIIVSDIEGSQVLVMTSSPSFSINDVAPALYDDGKPLINRSLHAYPPGSVFKMITALAGLESGSIDENTTVKDEGQITVGEQTFGNWYFRQYGRTEGEIAVVRALARSNDIYFYKIAEEVGIEDIAAMSTRFHLGDATGIELPSEDAGLVPTPAWKEKRKGEKWYLGDTYHVGIGQGDVLTTPLQINAMTAAIARKGVWCRPTILSSDRRECEDLELHETNLDLVRRGMKEACSDSGTAFPFFEWNSKATEEQKVACKTGTAEHGGQDSQGRRKTHAWFTMFYPFEKPAIAITVMLESTQEKPFLEGSRDAAPIAKRIWELWHESYGP